MRNRGTLALVFCYGVIAAQQSSNSNPNNNDSDNQEVATLIRRLHEREGAAEQLVQWLRNGDSRLVRKVGPPEPSSSVPHGAWEGLVVQLKREAPRHTELAALAAEGLTAVALRYGSHAVPHDEQWGVPIKSLVSLVEAGRHFGMHREAAHCAEAAAEALWALSTRASASVHPSIIGFRGIQALSELVLHGTSSKMRMWACAALAQVASDTCPAQRGQCKSATLLYNGAMARHVIGQEVHRGAVIDAAIKLILEGVAATATPSQVQEHMRFKRGVEAWAAAALLGELSRSDHILEQILAAGGVAALDALSKSTDALEVSHAMRAIRRLRRQDTPHTDL